MSVPSWAVENLCKVCENSRAGVSRVVTDLLSNSCNRSRFSPGYEGTDNVFYFLTANQHS